MRSKDLWLVQENHATVKLDSSVASRGIKTYSKSRIELRKNLQIVKKMLESSQFLSSEQPSEPKSLDVALNIARVEKIRSGNLRLQSTRRPFDSSFERKEASVTVEICVLCGRRILGDPGAVNGGARKINRRDERFHESLQGGVKESRRFIFLAPPLTAPGSPRMWSAVILKSVWNSVGDTI